MLLENLKSQNLKVVKTETQKSEWKNLEWFLLIQKIKFILFQNSLKDRTRLILTKENVENLLKKLARKEDFQKRLNQLKTGNNNISD